VPGLENSADHLPLSSSLVYQSTTDPLVSHAIAGGPCRGGRWLFLLDWPTCLQSFFSPFLDTHHSSCLMIFNRSSLLRLPAPKFVDFFSPPPPFFPATALSCHFKISPSRHWQPLFSLLWPAGPSLSFFLFYFKKLRSSSLWAFPSPFAAPLARRFLKMFSFVSPPFYCF